MEDEAQFDQILDITRTSEGGMTPQEARREIEEGLGPELTEKLQQITEENIEQQRDETIARDVQTQLIAAGRSKQEAKAAGKIWSSAFASLEAMGVDSKAIYEKLELRISDRTELEQAAIITDDPVITSRSQQLLDSFTDSENFISLLNKTNKRFKLNELRDIHRQLFGLDPLGKTKKQITDEIDRRRRREVDIADRGGAKREFDRKTLFATVTPRKTFVSEPSAQPDVTPAARSRARRRTTFEGPSVVPTAQEFLDVYEDSDAFFNLLARLEATAKVPEIRSIHRQLFNIESRYKTKKAIINQFKRQRLRELNPLYNAGQRFVLRAPYPDTDPDKILENAKSTGYEGKDAAEAADWVAGARKYGVEGMVWEMPDGSDGPRKARARELGYDVDQVMYRGAARRPILRGRADLYTTDNPAVAATYAEKPRQIMQQFYVKYGNTITIDVAGAKWDDISENAVVTLPDGKKKKLSALYGKRKAQNSTDLIVEFFNTELNYDTIVFENIIDVADVDDVSDEALKPSKTIASMVPNALRSVNAAFDLDKAANANVLAQAVEEGYEGEDVSDADAWLRAKEKGLKLTKSARMQRAKEQDYNVNNVVYHGSPVKDIKEFRANIGDYGTGVYVTNNAGYADIYKRKDMRGKLTKGAIRDYFAGVFSGKKYKLFIRGKGIKSSEIDTVLKEAGYEIKEHFFTNPRKRTADKKIRDDLMRLGYTHVIMDSTKKQKKDGIILVFEPKNLRSTDAAFDPDYADTPTLLAQETTEARMQRAQDMGFDTSEKLFRGTGATYATAQGITFATTNADVAATYAKAPDRQVSALFAKYGKTLTVQGEGNVFNNLPSELQVQTVDQGTVNLGELIGQTYPDKQNYKTDDVAIWAKDNGYDSVVFDQIIDRGPTIDYVTPEVNKPSKVVAIVNPNNVRSVSAQFDPDLADTPTFLAQDEDGITYDDQGDINRDENFKRWAGTDQIIEPEEVHATQFKAGQPHVIRAYHGTTQNFEMFDATAKGNVEGQFGKVNYFTTSFADAAQNYGASGTDLTNKIEKRSEEIFDMISDIAEREGMDRVVSLLQKRFPEANIAPDADVNDLALVIARSQLAGNIEQVLEVYIRTDNPFVISEELNWIEIFDNEANERQAIDLVAENNGVSAEDINKNRESYEDEIYEAQWQIESEIQNPFVAAIEEVAARYNFDATEIASEIYELTSESAGVVRAKEFEQALRNSEGLMYAEDFETGELISNQIIAEVIQELGYDSIILKDADIRFSGMDIADKTAHIHIFDENKTNIKSVNNRGTFDPTDPRFLFAQEGGTTRGTTRIMGELGSGSVLGTSPTIVKLLEAANQTTFLHESAHVFLEIYAALEQENAQVAEMMAPLREWLGWEVGQPLTVEMHEKFAGREEGFELYIKTGKAPSTALEKAFEAFRKWFNQIYQSVRGMANNLDPRAREFFDRMLATEEEIAEAQMKFHDSMTETVRDFMSPEQREKHRELQALAKKVATDKLFRKHLEQMQKSEKKEYKKEKKKISEQVRAEVSESPVFKAMSALADTESPVKLNRQATLDILGDERIVQIEPYLSEEGIDPELFAASFGYDTADQMFAEIAEDPDYDEIVEIEARRRMDDLQSDLLIDQESAQAEAIEASFNDAQVRKLKVELDAIAEKALKETIPLAAIRKRARDIIDTKPLNEIIKPAKYALQAMNLHKKAIKAAATQKWDDAFRLTQQAMLQHHLARYAFQARTEVEKGNRFLARFALHRKLDPKKIAPEFIQRIRAMMELPTASPERQAQIRQDLRMFEEQQAENNFPVALPAQVYADQDMTERRSMTLEQFREFRDSIKNLNKGGRLQSEQAKAVATKVSTEAADAIFASWGKRNLKGYSRSKKFGENIGSFLRQGDAAIIRLPYLAAWLQGRKDKQPIGMVRGVIVDTLYNDLSVAVNAKEKRLAALDESLLAIFKKHRISKNEIHAKVNVPEIEAGGQITKNQLFSLLLNMGTASNKQRVTDDVTLRGDAEQLLRVLEMRLDKKYFDAAQDIWDLINTQRNDLGAVHLRRTGVTPTWVEAEQLVTKYGTYAGGYYPLKYDPKADANRDLNERKQEDVFKQNSHGIAAKAQTKSGMLKERLTNVERPLYLNIDALIEHFAETATFIEMSEPIDAAWNLANSRQFGEALSQTWGSEYIEAVKTILRRSAADAVESGELGSKWLDKMLKATRINASIAILGLNLPTAALAPVSIFQTVIPRYGTKVFARGMVEFAKRGVSFAIDSANTMEKKSPFMRERTRLINREAHDVAKRKISEGVWNKAQAAGFVPMVQIEKYTVSGPLWWGVYKTSLMDGLSEQQAIAAADTAVGTTQGSGRVIDLSVMQSSTSELSKATLTFMYGYVSGYYGVVRTDVALAETNIAKTMQIVKHLMVLNALASTIETLIRQGLWEDDEEDAFLLAILSRMGRNSVLVPALSNFLSRYSSTTALEDVVKKGRQSAEYGWQSYDFESGKVDGEKAQKAAIKALQALGFAKGVPGMVQADKAISVYEEDDDPTMFEYLITGPDDDN
jgi:hypothetical protein